GLRRLIQRTRPEDEHEAAVARLAPLDAANAGDARLDRPPQDVESHGVADVQPGAFGNLAFDRHFGHRRRRVPEGALDHLLVRLEVIAIRQRELAAERYALLAHLIRAAQALFPAATPARARPQHRNQLERPGAVRRVAEKRAHRVRLSALN